jgi:hypothetical protein
MEGKGTRPHLLDTILKGQETLWPLCGAHLLSVYGPSYWIFRCLKHQSPLRISHKKPTPYTKVINSTLIVVLL